MTRFKRFAVMTIMLLGCFLPLVAYGDTLDVNVINMVPSAPEKPLNLTVTGLNDTRATISWEASSGATQYMVVLNGNQYTGSNAPGITLEDLEPNQEYEVYVVANNAGGNSTPSESLSFKTLPIPPAAPDAPALKHITGNSVILALQPLPENQEIKSYKIYLDGLFIKKVEEDVADQGIELDDLKPGSHSVNVAGVNKNKEGPLSKTLIFTISDLIPPVGLKMANHGMDKVWLSWLPVAGAKSYTVAMDGQVLAETDEAKIVIENLPPDTLYKIEVAAVSETGNKSIPANLEVKTLPLIQPLNPMDLIETTKEYLPAIGVYIESVFAVVAALILARSLKIALELGRV